MSHTKGSIPAAIGLLFVAPLVAEFLLGNLSLKLLPALAVLVPMYGGAALLIREMVRRAGRGWPSIFMLGAAYTLIEEGFTTQSLFNPDYLKMHMHLLAHAYIPALGIGAWWTLFVFNLHTFWSMAVSIALVEAVVPSRRTTPWLGRVGDCMVAALFVLGLVATTRFTLAQDSFVASRAQFLGAGLLCVVLIALAFLLPDRRLGKEEGTVPSPWLFGGVGFSLGVAVLITPNSWSWGAVAVLLALDILFLALVLVFSRRVQWRPLHTFSLAAGGALAYGLHAFFETPVGGGAGALARVGNVIFLTAAMALIIAGAKFTSNFEETS